MNEPHWDHLIHAQIDDSLAESEHAEFEALMIESAAARRRFWELAEVHGLAREAARLAWSAAEVELPAAVKTARRFSFQWRPLATAAVFMIMLELAALWWSQRGVVVEIAQATGGAALEWTSGSKVRMDNLKLIRGDLQMRLESGVLLDVAAPAELRLVDDMHALVSHGKVTVDVGERGKGFILDTPVTRVVDLGTRFGVEAKPDGQTDVMVIEGRIELFNPQRPQRTAELEQGEAVRVDAMQSIARIVNITGVARSSEWSTQPPPRECNIVSVRDNFGAAEGFHFYRIVPHGLRSGAVVYTNRPHVWEADEHGFPASLANADVVQTFFGELKRSDYAIELVMARPTELFVIMPKRGVPQAWLTQDFTRTGEEVVLREVESASVPHPFEVWKRTVRAAGTITLGPPNRDASGKPVGMYGIAAKSL